MSRPSRPHYQPARLTPSRRQDRAEGPGRIRRSPRWREERGDVPGWVLVTLMTAGLIAILLPLAEQHLREIFVAALDLVRP
ncbi:hypothetical protein EF847_04525 [Actinobacteria bacterium YIM 96077]|uniref:Uncharacterized protein n=1 Tax=Phytoactinopolyspora halophila TaxID=1981511 RepID=A0A329R281_9ACTN|nr:hypothetical protein [Phytoactinopolyspora halophila]AYY12085.1 hypothetical protein EF847_04525 [Actinobacteria bacterium YIM 96077]RAW18680.1 hypothetical protein DPM12_00985 [Phytoactinopolyspora halophila]